jgi:CRP-like cAMP-binding protein
LHSDAIRNFSMPNPKPFSRSKNQLLATLPDDEYQHLAPYLEVIPLSNKQVLHTPLEQIQYAYFPIQATISVLVVMEDAGTTEIGLIGSEGMWGLPIISGINTTPFEAMAQISGTALRIEAAHLKAAFDRGGTLQKQLICYMQAFLIQVAQGAACNALHRLEQRLARWLLTVQAAIGSDTLPLTQELIASMLGVHRPSVTLIAGSFQQAGIIHYSHGQIVIRDQEALEFMACECYRVIQREYARLLGAEHV